MKNVAVIPIILFAVISFSFSTSCSDALASGEFLQDTDAVYITINQVVEPGEPQIAGVDAFDASSTGGDDDPVEINLENPVHEVSRISMEVCDEDDYLALVRCEITERTEGFFCRAWEIDGGCCSVMLFGSSAIAPGTGPIFTLEYTVSDEAPIDECRVLTTENVNATDAGGLPLEVISAQGEYCFLADADQGDLDGDGILNDDDNCDTTPNGPDSGTCTEGTVGEMCTSNDDCDPNEVCSMNQEDLDVDGIGDACDDDDDNDAVLDDEDPCPRSRQETELDIIIDNCDTGVENDDFMDGCSMSDLIDQCAEKADIFIFGRFVLCVLDLTKEWQEDGLIQRKEKGAILRCAVRANLPWIRLNWD